MNVHPQTERELDVVRVAEMAPPFALDEVDVQEVNTAPQREMEGWEDVNSNTDPLPLVRLMVVKLQFVIVAEGALMSGFEFCWKLEKEQWVQMRGVAVDW